VRGLHRVHFAAAGVCDFHSLGAGRISLMFDRTAVLFKRMRTGEFSRSSMA